MRDLLLTDERTLGRWLQPVLALLMGAILGWLAF